MLHACPACGKLMRGPDPTDVFAVLGIPRAYALDLTVLERAFHDLSRRLHPDRFATAPAAERRMAVEKTTALNDAYRALREPLRRAEVLLDRAGRKSREEHTTQDGAFLTEIMEAREQAAEIKARLRAGDPTVLEDLRNARRAMGEKEMENLGTLDTLFRRADVAGHEAVVAAVAETTNRLRYYRGIRSELDALALEAKESA